jgi:carbamate kinase
VTTEQLRRYAGDGHFTAGSMGPKVEAACRFVESGGDRAVITSLDRIADAIDDLAGSAGTVVTREREEDRHARAH